MRYYQAKVLLVGTISNGGIGYFIKSVSKELGQYFNVDILPTHNDGNRLSKIWLFGRSLFRITTILFRDLLSGSDHRIIHINTASKYSFYRSLIIIWISYLFENKIILHIHCAGIEDTLINFIRFRLGGKFILDKSFKRCYKIVFVSHATLKKFETDLYKYNLLYPRKLKVIHDSIDLDNSSIEKNYTETKLRIIFAGRLVREKNPNSIIELALRLRKMEIEFGIDVTGDGYLMNSIKKRIEKYGLGNLIQIHGWVDEEKFKELMTGSHILFFPSVSEGMGYSILTAYRFGLAVIANNTGGIPEICSDGQNGYLAEENNMDQYVQFVEKLNKDRLLLQSIGLQNHNEVVRFGMGAIKEKYLELYGK